MIDKGMRLEVGELPEISVCPDLTLERWVEPMLRGQGAYKAVELHKCIQGRCAAYLHGRCEKYKTIVCYEEYYAWEGAGR